MNTFASALGGFLLKQSLLPESLRGVEDPVGECISNIAVIMRFSRIFLEIAGYYSVNREVHFVVVDLFAQIDELW